MLATLRELCESLEAAHEVVLLDGVVLGAVFGAGVPNGVKPELEALVLLLRGRVAAPVNVPSKGCGRALSSVILAVPVLGWSRVISKRPGPGTTLF